MVTVDGVTYRIERLDRGCYAAISLVDDTRLGVFHTGVQVRVEGATADSVLLERVGRAAIRSGRTSNVFNEPPPAPATEKQAEADEEEPPLTPLRRAPA